MRRTHNGRFVSASTLDEQDAVEAELERCAAHFPQYGFAVPSTPELRASRPKGR